MAKRKWIQLPTRRVNLEQILSVERSRSRKLIMRAANGEDLAKLLKLDQEDEETILQKLEEYFEDDFDLMKPAA